MTIGEKIKSKREQLGLSQKDLATTTGLTNVSISYIEKGQTPNLQSLGKICEALGLRIELVDIEKERTKYVIDAESLDYDVRKCCRQLEKVKQTLHKLTK